MMLGEGHRAFGRVVLVSVVFAVLAGCSGSEDKPRTAPRAVAIINGESITAEEFQAALDEIKSAGRGFFAPQERANSIKSELLERMIDAKLLMQEAKKKRVVLDPKLLEASIKLVFDQYPPGGLEEELLKKGKTLEAYRRDTETSLILHKLLKREVVDRIAVSSEEVEKYYQEHRNDFRQPERVRVRQIVTKSEEEAEALRKRILRGESFKELARKHSLGPEAKNGGDLDYFSKGRMPPDIEEACFNLWSSHPSKVVASPYGFHLFQLMDRKPAAELSLEQARAEIERRLTMEKTREAEAYYIRTLRERASIERDLDLLDRIH